jgi:adenylate cyclase
MTSQRAFLIADLAGYTALTEAHGGEEAARVVRRYAVLAEAACSPAVRIVERTGDAFLLVSASPRELVLTAVRLREAIEREPLFPDIRMGLDAGAVIEGEGGYFGSPLNVAARLAAYARPGQVLCTERITADGPPAGVEYRPLGPVRLRNVTAPLVLLEVMTASRAEDNVAVDPVCRMRVSPVDRPPRLPYGGRDWYFCSLQCARLFAERPQDYAEAPP